MDLWIWWCIRQFTIFYLFLLHTYLMWKFMFRFCVHFLLFRAIKLNCNYQFLCVSLFMFFDFVFLLLLKSFRVAGFKVRLVADMAQKFLSEKVLMSLYLIMHYSQFSQICRSSKILGLYFGKDFIMSSQFRDARKL